MNQVEYNKGLSESCFYESRLKNTIPEDRSEFKNQISVLSFDEPETEIHTKQQFIYNGSNEMLEHLVDGLNSMSEMKDRGVSRRSFQQGLKDGLLNILNQIENGTYSVTDKHTKRLSEERSNYVGSTYFVEL